MHVAQEWDHLTVDLYVKSVVKEGYQIELLSRPPLSMIPNPMKMKQNSAKLQSLWGEILTLLDKRAVEKVAPPKQLPGFYSQIFLVAKEDGGGRPVFNLKPLNRFVYKEKFNMRTQRDVTNALHKGDWAVSVDLKDAYFHIPIHKKSRHMLRFVI